MVRRSGVSDDLGKSSRLITHVSPKKRLGQHFLRRKDTALRIVESLKASPQDTVVEIGAGTGELTRILLESVGRVIAVEVDEACFPTLRVLADLNRNLELFLKDIRKLDLSGYGQVKVLGNLPYHLSGEILFWLIEQRKHWTCAVLTVQAEFAERLTAQVGGHDYSALSVIARTFVAAEKLFDIPPDAFVPPPRVRSTTIRINPEGKVEIPVPEKEFIKFVHSTFTHRRKTLANNLKMMGISSPDTLLEGLGYDKRIRPQELDVDDFVKLIVACS